MHWFFANIILADEINRATPRTQASLLECMEERQVTVDGMTRKLEEPFFVIATQNPLETTELSFEAANRFHEILMDSRGRVKWEFVAVFERNQPYEELKPATAGERFMARKGVQFLYIASCWNILQSWWRLPERMGRFFPA